MSDFEDDAIIKESLNSTYCKHHFGLWSHECGCDIIPRKRKVKMLNEDLKQELNRLKAENARLMEALEFYADDMNWQNVPATSHPDCIDFVSFIQEKDAGSKAREALEKLK